MSGGGWCSTGTSCGRPLGGTVATAFVIGLAFAGQLPAADDVVVEESAEQVRKDSSAIPAAGLRAFVVMGNHPLVGQQRVVLPGGPIPVSPTVELGSLFDRIVFGPESRAGRPAEDIVAQLRHNGEKRLALLGDVCSLSGDQQRILRLALASDLNGFATHVAAARSRYAGIEMSVRPGSLDRELVVELRAEATACRSRWQQFFGPASLFASTMPGVLESDQSDRLAEWVATRRADRWRSMLESVLLDDGTPALWQSDAAAAEALAILAADVPPLAVFAAACDPTLDARMTKLQRSLVMARMGRIPEQVLRPLVQPRAWVPVRHEIDRSEEPGVGHVERQLTMRQVLEEPRP